MLTNCSDRGNWVLTGRTYDNQRYSPLTQIDASNVTSLQVAGIAQTGMTASFETTPIVVNGVMYITTPTVDNKMKIMAMDATTRSTGWTNCFAPKASRMPRAKPGCTATRACWATRSNR